MYVILRAPDDTCEAGPAPIIGNPGDNHAPGGISTSRTPKMGVRTPILGVPGARRAPGTPKMGVLNPILGVLDVLMPLSLIHI